MHVIKMNDDKSLMTTVQATIYCGENNADTLLFLIPAEYNGTSIADCDVLIEYISPDGEDKTESLECDSELYKGYCQYRLKVDSEFTKYPGRVSLSLDINGDNSFNLKTGDAFIDIHSQCDEEIPSNKKYELEIKVEKNTEKIDELDKKVSDINLDDYYTSKDVDKKLEDKADSKDIEEINNSMKDLSDDLEDKASTKDLNEAFSNLNIKNGEGLGSLIQTQKIDNWTPSNPHVIEYFENPTNPDRVLIGELDENGNVIIKSGVFAPYSALFSGYGQITGEQSTAKGRRIIVLGEMSHGEGTEVFILGKYAHGEGNNVTVLGSGGHGEGMDTYVEKEYGHAEGKETQSVGLDAHAQNYKTIAKGAHSHAQNARTQANGECSTSMGIDTVADGYASFAGGNGSKATANNAFALNGKTLAQGENSTAIGDSTQAFGRASFAGGHKTITRDNAQGSRTGGAFTIAGSQYQDVRGIFNEEDTENEYADIVGGGTAETTRRNIYTLDWNGNVWLPGKVKVGGKSQDDANAKTLATLDDIEIAISALVDSSPETLNTLNEVAKALGNDPNFATTIMTLLGEKASASNVYTKDIIDSKFGEVDTALDTLLSIQSELWGESV